MKTCLKAYSYRKIGEKISEAAGNLEEAAGCFEELIGYLVAAKGEKKNEEEKTDE